MIEFSDLDKRWLEIVFYLFCRKIFDLNQNQNDILEFIKGYQWTNMFDYATLEKIILEEKLMINYRIIPNNHEFILVIDHPDTRLRLKKVWPLIEETEYNYSLKKRYRVLLEEELAPTTITPKLTTKKAHETIYSFLLAVRYMSQFTTQFKF